MNEEYLNQLAMMHDPFPLLRKLQEQPKVPLGMDPNFMNFGGAEGPMGGQTPLNSALTQPIETGGGVNPMPGASPIPTAAMGQIASMMSPHPQPQMQAPAPHIAAGHSVNIGTPQMPVRPLPGPAGRPSLAQLLGIR